MGDQKTSIQSWLHRQKTRELNIFQATEDNRIILECLAKRQTPGRSDPEDGLTHEIKCLEREIEVQKAAMRIKRRGEKGSQDHESVIAERQQ